MTKLSILIPYTEDRADMVLDLVHNIQEQSTIEDVEILTDVHPTDSIGTKRNRLLQMANGDYVCFIDSDDEISDDFVSELMYGINNGYDCCSLRGVITWDGVNPEIFEHSIRYKAYATTSNAIKYERYPNHLNCIKASIAKRFVFPEINHGEDTDWATQVFNSGLINTEHFIDKVLYHYQYRRNK